MAVFTPENGFGGPDGLAYDAGQRNRLNTRHRAFIEPVADRIRDARLLDLASHDGRWSLAALRAGAAHVTGIEVRQDLIDRAPRILSRDEQARTRFIQGDVFEVMPQLLAAGDRFDVIFCLGLFYHVMDHDRMLRQMLAFRPRLVVFDSTLAASDQPMILVGQENTDSHLNAAPGQHAGNRATIGFVSRPALNIMCRNYGYGVDYVDWEALDLPDTAKLDGYFRKNAPTRRYSAFLTPL
ncbi:MAG: class I SAM-dependent methyltransferase [Rhodobacter sp.]|jgi:SAM-dependent methyltransferase|nr:class I SAM-dependent methyltransferase [Rhodobacter sp.]